MNYCGNCGVKLDPSASFCHNCGTKVAFSSETYTANGQGSTKPKSKFLAGILAIVVGTLGIHNFYLGYTKKAVAQLLLFVFWLGWVSCIWGIIDAIMIFTDKIATDANGVLLTENF